MTIVFKKDTGEIVCASLHEMQQSVLDHLLSVGDVDALPGCIESTTTHYIVNEEILQIPNAPSDVHTWDWGTHTWVLNNNALEQVKGVQLSYINAARNQAEAAGFTAYGRVFDSDDKAVQRISVSAQAAQLVGDSFVINWTCADNTVITLNQEQMIMLPLLMAQAGNTLHVKARDLKERINAATSIDEVLAVVW